MNLTLSTKPIHHTPIAARMPVLKVVGLGGAGSNAINRMIELGLSGVDFIAANTDCQALETSLAPTKLHLVPRPPVVWAQEEIRKSVKPLPKKVIAN